MAGASPCYHISTDNGSGRAEYGSLGDRAFLKAVKAGELDSIQLVYLPEYQARSSANRSHGAAKGVVLLHKIHKRPAGGQIPGARHPAREYDYVIVFNFDPGLEGGVGSHGDVVRGGDEGLITYGD